MSASIDSPAAKSTSEENVVILGAGVIGLSAAFYLSNEVFGFSRRIVLLDSSPLLLACASGRAGGFLAKDWFAPASAELGELSFRLHSELAQEHDGRKRWGYSPSVSHTLSNVGASGTSEAHRGDDWLRQGTSRATVANQVFNPETPEKREAGPEWLRLSSGNIETSSTSETTAQLDPRLFCEFLLGEIQRRGVDVRNPVHAQRVAQSPNGQITGLVISNPDGSSEETIACTRLLICAGPWSSGLFQRLFSKSQYQLPISTLAGHSIIVRAPTWKLESDKEDPEPCDAVFARIEGLDWYPECFSRINGDIYIAGINSSEVQLPAVATDVKENEDDIGRLKNAAKILVRDDMDIVGTGFCHRPVTPGGVPILAAVPKAALGISAHNAGDGKDDVFICAGHGPWGISLSLGSGKVMAEMILGRTLSANVDQLGLQ